MSKIEPIMKITSFMSNFVPIFGKGIPSPKFPVRHHCHLRKSINSPYLPITKKLSPGITKYLPVLPSHFYSTHQSLLARRTNISGSS